MKRYSNIFISEFKLLRFNLYIPIIICFLYILFFTEHVMSVLLIQFILVPMSAWWIVWTYEHNLKPRNYTLFKTILIRPKKYFCIKFIVGTILNCILISIGVIFTFDKQEWVLMLSFLLPQILFFSSLAYALIILTKSASISISIVYLYVLNEILPIVDIPFWPNVFITQEVFIYSDALDISITALLYAITFIYFTNVFLNLTSSQQRNIRCKKKQLE